MGRTLKKWVFLFYSNIKSAVLNNGFATEWFRPSKGLRQGCPLSLYLFILSTEILSNKIRQNREIKGITVFGNEIKISQFTDDTNLFCADITYVENALKTVHDFSMISGLRLNVKRTKAIWLGKWEGNKTTTPLNIEWIHHPVKMLCIYVSYDEKRNIETNFMINLRKLQTKLGMCGSRDLTLSRREMIIKSLGL